ncbi:MAG: phosphotransferase [Saprospiraceae bacterium]|nr:phosphotransferase [Saprospiraceae bacterium]
MMPAAHSRQQSSLATTIKHVIDQDKIINKLDKLGLLDRKSPIHFQPLTGGVSSDIYLIDNGDMKYVIKEARRELKVADLWQADLSRNLAERRFIAFIGKSLPESVPNICYSDPEDPYFIMEFLAPPLENWKEKLLGGRFNIEDVRRVSKLLAAIHNLGSQDPTVPEVFGFKTNFYELRIEPYLVTTAHRHHLLEDIFLTEASRLDSWGETPVHGDFSPKNILLSPERVVILDHEVANYGDPAFDLAFLLNHLLLKLIYQSPVPDQLPDLPMIAWTTYFDHVITENQIDLQKRSSRLLLMLMLARIDGKSPVEYLNQVQQDFVRKFVYQYLPDKSSENFMYYYANLLETIKQL